VCKYFVCVFVYHTWFCEFSTLCKAIDGYKHSYYTYVYAKPGLRIHICNRLKLFRMISFSNLRVHTTHMDTSMNCWF